MIKVASFVSSDEDKKRENAFNTCIKSLQNMVSKVEWKHNKQPFSTIYSEGDNLKIDEGSNTILNTPIYGTIGGVFCKLGEYDGSIKLNPPAIEKRTVYYTVKKGNMITESDVSAYNAYVTAEDKSDYETVVKEYDIERCKIKIHRKEIKADVYYKVTTTVKNPETGQEEVKTSYWCRKGDEQIKSELDFSNGTINCVQRV
jgi:hypothetical protein